MEQPESSNPDIPEPNHAEMAVNYWRSHILSDSRFNPEWRCLVILHVHRDRTICGHHFIVTEEPGTEFVHPRQVFRAPIEADAKAVILSRYQRQCEPVVTAADIEVARHFTQAGELLHVPVLDYVIVGQGGHASLREQGHIS